MLFRIFTGGFDLLSLLMYIVSVLMVVFIVNPLHECAHGMIAYKLGDDTAKRSGRLTLNPLAHIDYMGALMMLLVGFGWAKPVPINARRFKHPKAGLAVTALAGPVSNLLAAVICGLIYNGIVAILVANNSAVMYSGSLFLSNDVMFFKYVLLFFEYLLIINISLAVFNLVPIPPLDGSKILMAFMPDRLIFKMAQYQMFFSIGLLVFAMFGFRLLYPVQMLLYYGIDWLTHLPFAGVF